MEKIRELFPKAKIIVMLRDPVNRIYSNFWMNVRQGGIVGKDFEKAIEDGYLNSLTTKYADNLKNLFSLFPKEQVHVIRSEDFFSDEVAVVKKVFKFLGIKDIDVVKLKPVVPHGNPNKPQKHYPPINPTTRTKLREYFKEEVLRTEQILGRKMFPSYSDAPM